MNEIYNTQLAQPHKCSFAQECVGKEENHRYWCGKRKNETGREKVNQNQIPTHGTQKSPAGKNI